MDQKPVKTSPHSVFENRMSVRHICGALGISAFSFYEWRRKNRDFPEQNEQRGYSLEEVRGWLDTHPEVGQGIGNKVTGRREHLMCDNLEKRNALLDRQLAEAERRLVNGDKVIETLTRERTIALESFRKRVLSEIPAEAEGKRAPAIAVLLREAFDEFLDDVAKAAPHIASPN
jgi:hypothetical protein